MLHGQVVYCNNTFLKEIIEKRKNEPYKTLYQILYRLSDIYVDINKEELKRFVESNTIYNNLFNRSYLGLHSLIEWRHRINYDKISDEVFFVMPNYVDSELIAENKGGLVFTSDKIDYVTVLNRLKVFYLIPLNDRIGIEEDSFNSWPEVFDRQKMRPINSLIISDNFLFSEDFEQRKEYSLYPLLKCLIPQTLDIDFHLAIFFYNKEGLFSKERAEAVIKEIKQYVNVKEDKLKVSIIAHTKSSLTHDRHIISNYFFTESGVGFSVIGEDGIQQIAKGECKCVFHSISNLVGNATVKHEYNIMQGWLKKIYYREVGTGPLSYYAGDEFKHRLLNQNPEANLHN